MTTTFPKTGPRWSLIRNHYSVTTTLVTVTILPQQGPFPFRLRYKPWCQPPKPETKVIHLLTSRGKRHHFQHQQSFRRFKRLRLSTPSLPIP